MTEKRKSRRVSLTTSRGGTYCAKWRDPVTGKAMMRSLRTRDRKLALERAGVIRRQINAVKPVAIQDLLVVTVRDSRDAYIEWHRQSNSSTRRNRENLPATTNHFLRYLGEFTLAAHITPEGVMAFVGHIQRSKLARATQREIIRDVRAWLRWAASNGMAPSEAGQGITLPKPQRPREVQWLSLDEIKAAILAAREYSPDGVGWVFLSILTGLRASEIFRLLWSDVNLETGMIRVETHNADQARGIEGAETKCETSRRVVPIPEPLLTWMRQHRELSPGPYVMMHPKARRFTRGQAHGALAVAKDPDKRAKLALRNEHLVEMEREAWRQVPPDQWLPYKAWPRKLIAWIRENGCPRWDARVARHTFATILVKRGTVVDRETGRERGITTLDLQHLMGHASVTTTERHYLGHFPLNIDTDLGRTLGLI